MGEKMKLEEMATVRTGAVIARKTASEPREVMATYKVLNLKSCTFDGHLELQNAEEFASKEVLKDDFLTQKGDVLIRLSAPYTAVAITEEEQCGFVVPSHFAIIRANRSYLLPEYILWFLRRESTLQTIEQNSSGRTSFGTISSGFIGSLNFREIPLDKQRIIGQLVLLSDREQILLHKLAYQKEIYNKALVNQIYDSFKRGN